MVDESFIFQRSPWRKIAGTGRDALDGHADLEAAMQPHNPAALDLTPEYEARALRRELRQEEDREKEAWDSSWLDFAFLSAASSRKRQRELRAAIEKKEEKAALLRWVRENSAFIAVGISSEPANKPALTRQAARLFQAARPVLPIALICICIGLLGLPPIQFHLPDLVNKLIDREIPAIGLALPVATLALMIKRRNEAGKSRKVTVGPPSSRTRT